MGTNFCGSRSIRKIRKNKNPQIFHATRYKQEDVKVNLLNPKSEQHLICGCSKNNECGEEKEILTSSWSFVLE